MTMKKKKKLKQPPDEKLYFFHEANRDLWEGRSKEFANPDEVMEEIYGVNPFASHTGCHKFILTVPFLVLVALAGFGNLEHILDGAVSPEPVSVVTTGIILLVGLYLGVKAILDFEQMRLEAKYHPDDEELARALADVVRHGEYLTGYVEKVRDYHKIHFYYYDKAGNRQDATYTYDKKDLAHELKFGSRLALIQYNDRFVAL